MVRQIICQLCTITFSAKSSSTKYCATCRMLKREREINCQVCSVTFITKSLNTKYCDPCGVLKRKEQIDTYHKAQLRKIQTLHHKVCEYCGQPFDTYRSRQKFCSKICANPSPKQLPETVPCSVCGTTLIPKTRAYGLKYCVTCSGAKIHEAAQIYSIKISKKGYRDQHSDKFWHDKTCTDCQQEFKSYTGCSTRCRTCQNTFNGITSRERYVKARATAKLKNEGKDLYEAHLKDKTCLDCQQEFKSYDGRSVRCRECYTVYNTARSLAYSHTRQKKLKSLRSEK